MDSALHHSMIRFRASILHPEASPPHEVLSVAELDALCTPSPEHVEEIILLCLLAARQYPAESASLIHIPWILSAMAINHPDRLAPYVMAVAGLLEAPSKQIREHAAHLIGDWWQRGHRDLFAYLLKALHDPSPAVVRAALVRLQHCNAAQAIEVLEHCRRVLDAASPAQEQEPLPVDPAEPAIVMPAYFSQMALLLAKQGLINEILLRQFFDRVKGAQTRAALPAPVREWLLRPTGSMDELLAKYTQQELATFA